MEKEGTHYNRTWLRYMGSYKCGNCGRIPFYIDISERNICYNCHTVMKWYEGENGERIPLKWKYNKQDEPLGYVWDSFRAGSAGHP